MSRDENVYPEPEEFRPERHLGVARDGSSPLPSGYVFGFGRRCVCCLASMRRSCWMITGRCGRICPGQAFADATLWIAIASIIASFDVRPPLDTAGAEVCPPAAFRSGFTR